MDLVKQYGEQRYESGIEEGYNSGYDDGWKDGYAKGVGTLKDVVLKALEDIPDNHAKTILQAIEEVIR